MPDFSPPTIQDIAQRVGVSKVAVSVVLNGANSNTRVSEATRQRILEAASEMNYHANAAAQGLNSKRMNTLGVLFGYSDPLSPIMSVSLSANILQGAALAAERAEYDLMLMTRPWRDNAASLSRLFNQRTDGLVVAMPTTDTTLIPSLINRGFPLVFIGYAADAYGIASVDMDQAAGAALATQHLLDLGHRRIAHIQGEDFYTCTGLRLSGFLQTMLNAGIVTPPEYVMQSTYNGVGVWETAQSLLSLPEPPTAIFAGNDGIGLVTMQAARAMGISVPEQLSIVGFDDTVWLPLLEMPLTTIRQPFLEYGDSAATLLIRQLNGEEVEPITHFLPHELVLRQTTAPPAKR